MKIEDLRLGNYLEGDRVFRVNGINRNKDILVDGIWVDFRIAKPISLTEEWHNRFGVKRNKFMSFEYTIPRIRTLDCKIIFSGDYVFLRQTKNDKPGDDYLVSVWNKDLMGRDMYVHEFQNLYFTLTGEELTSKTDDK